MGAGNPAPGPDGNLLPGGGLLLADVAVSMHPDHALLVRGEELVDEEAPAVHHVRKALDPAVVVLEVGGGGEELMLAHDDSVAGGQVQRRDVAWRVTAERDFSRRLRLEQQQRHTAERTALEPLL